jgi:hypothetical protein
MSNQNKGPVSSKPWQIYLLGIIVVVLCVGAAVAHVVFTNNASPIGPAPTSVSK